MLIVLTLAIIATVAGVTLEQTLHRLENGTDNATRR